MACGASRRQGAAGRERVPAHDPQARARHPAQPQHDDRALPYAIHLITSLPVSTHQLLFTVHILSGDLMMHKRTLEPIKTIIYGLRRYDLDRAAAFEDLAVEPGAKIQGFMSKRSKIYLVSAHLGRRFCCVLRWMRGAGGRRMCTTIWCIS